MDLGSYADFIPLVASDKQSFLRSLTLAGLAEMLPAGKQAVVSAGGVGAGGHLWQSQALDMSV
jgi:hypothetical protein